jgi:hypothetical protein
VVAAASVVDLAYKLCLFTDYCTSHLTMTQHPSVEWLMNHVGLQGSDSGFPASSFPSHHNNAPNNAPSLSPLLEGEVDTNSDSFIENKAEWLDEDPIPVPIKRAPPSKTSEVRAIEVSDNALFCACCPILSRNRSGSIQPPLAGQPYHTHLLKG